MALAFKRAVTEAEKAVTDANNNIKEWYKTTVNPAVIVDYEGIKAVQGNSTQNPNSVDGPKNITLVNWIADNARYFHSIWGDVQYKDKEYALPILLQHLEKVVIHVDDKGPSGKYSSYSTEWKGKELHVSTHINFENYPQSLNLTDDDNGNVDNAIWGHLDDVADLTYELRKTHSIKDSGSQYNTYVKYLKDKVKKDIPIEVDWEAIKKIDGKSEEYSNKPHVPNRARIVKWFEENYGFYYVYYAIETLVKDDLGMEAFLETFDKVLVTIEGGSTESRSGPHAVTKDGKTLKFTFKINLSDIQNISADYSELAKKIEALL